jgi:HPr kinase/phosphorylase
MKSVPVSILFSNDAKHLRLRLLYGKKLIDANHITKFRIQKPGLGLAGYTEHIHEGRVQILGNTEISYLLTLPHEERKNSIEKLCEKKITCFIITKNLKIPIELLETIRKKQIPLLKTNMISSEFIQEISLFLEKKLAPETILHGVLVDVHGIGVFIMGRSGIGKSECALELIKRGHRLVADDAVHIKKMQGELIGNGNDLLKYNIELRGLGILNIRDMYGVSSIRKNKKIEIVVNFVDWNKDEEYDRTGLDTDYYEILNTKLPKITLPISPGRNIAIIIEAAAKNHMLKMMGYDAAKELQRRLLKKINENASKG